MINFRCFRLSIGLINVWFSVWNGYFSCISFSTHKFKISLLFLRLFSITWSEGVSRCVNIRTLGQVLMLTRRDCEWFALANQQYVIFTKSRKVYLIHFTFYILCITLISFISIGIRGKIHIVTWWAFFADFSPWMDAIIVSELLP